MKTLRLPEVIAKVGLSKSTIYAMIKAGTFPKQRKLGTRASGWIEEEVDAWIASRVTAGDTTPAGGAPPVPHGRKADGGAKARAVQNARQRGPRLAPAPKPLKAAPAPAIARKPGKVGGVS